IVSNGKVDPSFLYYSLRPRKKELLSRGSAAGVRTPILNKSAFCEIRVKVPEMPLQQRVAAILSAYDDLIEVNRRRVAVIEEMAQRLFEEWFVRFRFPGRERHSIVESTSGAPLPDGWSIVRLRDVLSALETGSRPKGGIKTGAGEVPSIGAENVDGL